MKKSRALENRVSARLLIPWPLGGWRPGWVGGETRLRANLAVLHGPGTLLPIPKCDIAPASAATPDPPRSAWWTGSSQGRKQWGLRPCSLAKAGSRAQPERETAPNERPPATWRGRLHPRGRREMSWTPPKSRWAGRATNAAAPALHFPPLLCRLERTPG